MTVFLIVLACLLILSAGGIAGFLFSCLRRDRLFDPALLSPDAPRTRYDRLCAQGAQKLLSFEHEDLTLLSLDRKRLRAALYSNGQSERFVVLVHGYHSTPERDFGAIAHLYLSLGYGILLIHQRAHASSDGRIITYGVKEQHDLNLWCRELVRKYPDARILLHGISMGGATVVLATQTELPAQVKGIVDDCGYTTPFDEIAHVAKTSLHLPRLAVHTTNFFCLLIARCSLRSASVTRAGAQCTLPKLYLHGEADTFVPYEMGIANFQAAAEPKRFVSIPGAGHAMCYFTDPETVGRELTDFAKQVLEDDHQT